MAPDLDVQPRNGEPPDSGFDASAPQRPTARNEVASVPYVLGTHQFGAIKREDPVLGQKLLIYSSVMFERLTFASRMIAGLRR